MAPKSFFTRVHGARIHGELAGDLARDPALVVLLHGLGVSSRYFRPLAERLAEDRLVLALDLPGTGLSERPDHTLDITEPSEVLDGWLRTLGLGRVTLVGHSFGCQVAAHVAVGRPQRVERLVLIAPYRDPFVSHAWALRMASLLPRGSLAEVPNAAHAVHLSAPGAVASLIRSFLTKVISPAKPTLELEKRA